MKKLRATIILLMAFVSLTGCSSMPSVKSDSEIMNELSETKYYSETYPEFTIEDVEIVKRQTDVENKTDKVYVTLTVINEDESISGYIDMVVLYGLYNDGWVLDSCEVDFGGANEGSFFFPISSLDLSIEEISSALSALTGETFTDVVVYATESDLEKGIEVYSVTGTENHTYMTGKIDATLTYSFFNSAGYWEAPTLATNSYEEDWHIAGNYYITDEYGYMRERWDGGVDVNYMEIIDDSPVDFISVKYTNSYSDGAYTWTGDLMYDAQLITQQSLMLKALRAGGSHNKKYIEDYGFSVTISGDYSSITSFEYVTHLYDKILYIGKDNIAYSSGLDDYDIDEYNRRIVLDVWNLLPV